MGRAVRWSAPDVSSGPRVPPVESATATHESANALCGLADDNRRSTITLSRAHQGASRGYLAGSTISASSDRQRPTTGWLVGWSAGSPFDPSREFPRARARGGRDEFRGLSERSLLNHPVSFLKERRTAMRDVR